METDQEFELMVQGFTDHSDRDLPPVRSEFHDIHQRTMKLVEADQAHWNQDGWAENSHLVETWVRQESGGYLFLSEGRETALIDYTAHCDTTYCYAGFAIVAEGGSIVRTNDGMCGVRWEEGGVLENLHHATMRILGLTDVQANVLYELSDENLEEFKKDMGKLTGIDFE